VSPPTPSQTPSTGTPAGSDGLATRAWRLIAGDEVGPAPVTNTIIVVNVAVYIGMAIYSKASTALFSMPQETMQVFGANESLFTVGDSRFETLITSCFLHFSLLHLGFNMVALRQVGPFVERSVGPGRFAPLYIIAGILGSVTSALYGWRFHGDQLSAGASGAICGIIGAAMVLGARTQGIRGPLAVGMARWLGGIIVLGFIARFDNAAHIGGAVGGAAIAAIWQRGKKYPPFVERAILVLVSALVIASGVVVYYRDTHDPFVFADESVRQRAVVHFMVRGQCVQARAALQRAEKLHPSSQDTRDLELDLMRHCP
jgi:rhomboid protease GluP